ncbi:MULTISPECIES: hypothetical protein [Yersinia pseudotuberculosis complex]|uniref:Putative type IV secretion system protein IcmC/DotIE n=1 Tax=Yersinia pseudotuberculosis serotype O:1b (strain IP 31758) TaxID=349747 RepID=A0A0U1QTN8_YERP3|nr:MULTISPECIES: hypothetical protein [Yersinia pseudotuberculosis complex]EKN4699726.1 type IV secretion protein DotIE [Yersinia ruckeri]ABS45747.1 putative type IV secretion system protein IcmC/DotIE [Yersinia pseudotuberculosis IP 31758]MCE4113285.1 type IV secretion protein DotIE [Yersinia pseudotuberculosis]RYC26160.1 type IV secretion protein DotIE [Yersinia pseudotuberculosis]UFA64129.1 Uncharacterized protein YP598_4521 [Yersinia pseudotuberculosis]
MDKFPDLMTLAINFGKIMPPFIMLLQGICGIIGMWLFVTGLTDVVGVSNPNMDKYIASRSKYSVSGAIVKMVIGSFFVGMATLQLVGILSRSLTGDYANSRMLSYSSAGTTLEQQAQLATLGLLSVVQAVGFVALMKGLFTLVGRFNGENNANLGTASTVIIGGVLAWNFKWFADVINNQFGYNIIGLFGAWN